MNIESTLTHTDFKVKDNGREYRVYPISEEAIALTKAYKGVIMSQFAVTHGNFASFQDWANKKTVLTWVEEIE